MRSVFFGLAALAALAGCQTEPKSFSGMAKAEQVATGEEIAARNCGRCHGLGDSLTSPRPAAPPLRLLAQRYHTEVLQEELIAGLHFGIAEMPKFELSVAESDALTAYIESLGKSPPQAQDLTPPR